MFFVRFWKQSNYVSYEFWKGWINSLWNLNKRKLKNEIRKYYLIPNTNCINENTILTVFALRSSRKYIFSAYRLRFNNQIIGRSVFVYSRDISLHGLSYHLPTISPKGTWTLCLQLDKVKLLPKWLLFFPIFLVFQSVTNHLLPFVSLKFRCAFWSLEPLCNILLPLFGILLETPINSVLVNHITSPGLLSDK